MNKPNIELPSKDCYPCEIEEMYERISERINSNKLEEDLELLIDNVYKSAYVDGFQDALFYKQYY